MRTPWKMLLITLAAGIPAFLLGPVIWPPSPDIRPTQDQLPYLIVLSAIEALTFGFGVAFILYGRRLVRRMTGSAGRAAGAMYASLAWLLVSWWPHDNMHIHNALNINGLIVIDYAFHLTLIMAAAVLAYSFFAIFRPTSEVADERGTCPVDQPDCGAPLMGTGGSRP